MTAPTITGFDLDTIRGKLTSPGYAYVGGLPEDFDYPGELASLGPLVPQYGGALVRDVKPDPDVSNTVACPRATSRCGAYTLPRGRAGKLPSLMATS